MLFLYTYDTLQTNSTFFFRFFMLKCHMSFIEKRTKIHNASFLIYSYFIHMIGVRLAAVAFAFFVSFVLTFDQL